MSSCACSSTAEPARSLRTTLGRASLVVAIYLLMFKLYGLDSPGALFATSPASLAREYLLQIRTFLKASRQTPLMVASFGMVASFLAGLLAGE